MTKFKHLNVADLGDLSDDDLAELATSLLDKQEQDRRQNQIMYYKPASDRAAEVHLSEAKYVGIGGGNGSSKTETALAEAVALSTGVFPRGLEDTFKAKFRGPIKVRVVVESKTTTLTSVILEKLKWWAWTGVDSPGGERGHWGWIPKTSLVDGEWDKSWSEKFLQLRVLCRDPDNPEKILGESSFQFMSHNQDPSDFASGDFHIVILDEPPRLPIFTENEARTMRVAGRIFLSMTWPDDPAITVDWIHEKMYEKGQKGPNKSEDHDWFELWTTENPHLNQDSVAKQMKNWSETEKAIRIYGRSLMFGNRIHPLFTDVSQHWCFRCNCTIVPQEGKCTQCGTNEIEEYCHVTDFTGSNTWPCVFLLDPHPRKPHMFMWARIDPSDDIWVVAEGEMDGDEVEVARIVGDIEESLGLYVTSRIIDPNMGRSPASTSRELTWQDAFDRADLRCDLADDSSVGRKTINQFLRPDEHTTRPRIHVHDRCYNFIQQMKRYVWAEYKHSAERDVKQIPRDKYDDYPTLLKYLMNSEPTFHMLRAGAPIIKRTRKGAYS